MTITYGFYDSISSDRLYNARQMGSIFDGLILDGVYANYGDHFEVLEDTGMNVSVGIGRSWFDHTWTYNDALLSKTITTADALLNRIDIIYLEVNENVGVRANSIGVLAGTPASSPVPPDLINTSSIHQYALAHIYVGAGVTVILQANIADMVGTENTPFVELIVESEDLQAQIWAIVGDVNPPLIDLTELKPHNHDGSPTVQIAASGLATDAVETAKIKNSQVTSIKLAADSVIASKILNGNVTGEKLAINAVETTKIKDSQVTAIKLAAESVIASKILNGNVTAEKLALNSVETAKIKDSQVTEIKLATDSVAAVKIKAGAIIAGKMANGAVDATAILANDIVDDTKVGNRVPQAYRRQGGASGNWNVQGATTYIPTTVRMQMGFIRWSGSAASSGQKSVNFPIAFSNLPLVFVQVEGANNFVVANILQGPPYDDGFNIQWSTHDGSTKTSVDFAWFAIGPE